MIGEKVLQQHIEQLEEENKTLKDNVEFLHSCLDDRDKSIAIMQEENKNLKEEVKKRKMVADENGTHYDMLEEENKKLDEAYQAARDRVIELLGDIELYLDHIKELIEENKKLKEENEILKEYKSMYEGLIIN